MSGNIKISKAFFCFLIVTIMMIISPNNQAFGKDKVPQDSSLKPEKVYASIAWEYLDAKHHQGYKGMKEVKRESSYSFEFWNVGAEGGEQYSKATMKYKTTLMTCEPIFFPENRTFENHCKTAGTHTSTYEGTFTGGPGGTLTFFDDGMKKQGDEFLGQLTGKFMSSWKLRVVDGKELAAVPHEEYEYSFWFRGLEPKPQPILIDNPEAFNSKSDVVLPTAITDEEDEEETEEPEGTPEPTKSSKTRITPTLDRDVGINVSYMLGYDFPFESERAMPLLITFKIMSGPPGAYISKISSITPGWDVFVAGTDFKPDSPTPTVWEYGYGGVNWDNLMKAAADGVPVAFEAVLEVFTGYDGAEQIFEPIPVRFEVKVGGVATVTLLPGRTIRDIIGYKTASAELDGKSISANKWMLAKPGQRLRVHQNTRALVRCVSGASWRIERGVGDTSYWDMVFGRYGGVDFSHIPKPIDQSYAEYLVDWSAGQLVDEKIKNPAIEKSVTKLFGKTAYAVTSKGMDVLTIIGVGEEEALGGEETFGVRMRSEVGIEFHTDRSVVVYTFEGAPDVIGSDGSEIPLPVGYKISKEPGINIFSAPVLHEYGDSSDWISKDMPSDNLLSNPMMILPALGVCSVGIFTVLLIAAVVFFSRRRKVAKPQPVGSQSGITTKFCPHCGSRNNAVAVFCIHCGKKISSSEMR